MNDVIKGVVWDLDETLIREESATVAALNRTAALGRQRYGIPAAELSQAARRCARARWQSSPAREYAQSVGISATEGLWCHFHGEAEPVRVLRAWAPSYRIGVWEDALAEFDVSDSYLGEWMAEHFPTVRRSYIERWPDAFRVLGALRGTMPRAVLTNGASCLQREKLEAAGLEDWFDVVVVSGDIGCGKPDPRPFALCAQELGIEPAELLMIGDSLERDVIGARSAGYQALWLDRFGSQHDPARDPAGVPRVDSLDRLDVDALRNGRLKLN